MMAVANGDAADRENPPRSRIWWCAWRKKTAVGYRRIQGALSNLGHEVGRGTTAEMLARQMEPAPERKRKITWKEFLTRHWDMIVAQIFLPSKPGRDAAYTG